MLCIIIIAITLFTANITDVDYTVYEDNSAAYTATITYADATMVIDAVPLNGLAALDSADVTVIVESYFDGYAKGKLIQCYEDSSCAVFTFIEKN